MRSEEAKASENFRLRRACRCPAEWSTGGRQNVFRMQQKPHGSCGSPVDPLVSGLVKHPGAPVRRVMVRPDAEDSSARGEERRRKQPRRPGNDALRRGLEGSGTTAVDPGRTGSSVFKSAELSDLVFLRVRGCRAPSAKGRSGCSDAPRPIRPKEHCEHEPHERQRTQRVRKAGGRANRRGGEKSRGRTVPGEASPGHTDLSADAAVGA